MEKKTVGLAILIIFSTSMYAGNNLHIGDMQTIYISGGFSSHSYTDRPIFDLSGSYDLNERLSAEINASFLNLTGTVLSFTGPTPDIRKSYLDLTLTFKLIKQNQNGAPFNISLLTKGGLEYYRYSDLLMLEEDYIYPVAAGMEISSNTCFDKVSQNLFGAISFSLLPTYYINSTIVDNQIGDYNRFGASYNFTKGFVSCLRVDLIYKHIDLFLSSESVRPLDLSIQSPLIFRFTHVGLGYFFRKNK